MAVPENVECHSRAMRGHKGTVVWVLSQPCKYSTIAVSWLFIVVVCVELDWTAELSGTTVEEDVELIVIG
jgi:hypothetical protein